MSFGFNDMQALTKLLNVDAAEERSDSSDDEVGKRKPASRKQGPGSIGPSGEGSSCVATALASTSGQITEKSGKIWTDEELEVKTKSIPLDILNDPRETPKIESYFSQAVSSEDIYLQMGYKTPCTSSCENFIVKIDLPGEVYANIKLDIKPELLIFRSPKYFLHLPLPHKVDPNAGSAKWDHDKEKLTVTLKLSRELDFLNF